jgi:hypothetical protein
MFVWLIVVVTFLIPRLSETVRDSGKISRAVMGTLAIHHLAAYVHSYVALLPGAGGDSEGFVAAASDPLQRHRYNQMSYVKALHAVFQTVGSSRFLAAELSVLGYSLSLLIIIYLATLVGRDKNLHQGIWLYGLLPSPLIHFSVPLREVFQSLALASMAYSACRLRVRLSVVSALLFWCGFSMLVALHVRIYYMALGIAALTALLLLGRFGRGVRILISSIFLIAAMIGFVNFGSFDFEQGLQAADKYRAGVAWAGGRAFYGGELDRSSVVGIITSVPRVFLLYMTSPFPWQIENGLDLYCLFENWLRIFLFVRFARAAHRTKTLVRREQLLFLSALFLWVELVWSLGTGNWGTALRHHSVVLFIPAVLGVAGPSDSSEISESPEREGNPRSTRQRIRRRRNRARGGRGGG